MADSVKGPDIYIGGKDSQRTEPQPRAKKPRQQQMSGREFKRKLERLKKRGVSEYRGMSRS